MKLFISKLCSLDIYSYISDMKNLFKDKTQEEINELLTKTDVPLTWVNKLYKEKSGEKKDNK